MFSQARLACLIAALLLHPVSHADIYKWVDANGKVHYSDKKDGAGPAAVGAIRPDAAPVSAPAVKTPSWQERERAYQRRQQEAASTPPGGSSDRPKRLSHAYGSNQVDNDQAKCALARDVISGAVRHTNGSVTDANDRQIAQQDLQAFCR